MNNKIWKNGFLSWIGLFLICMLAIILEMQFKVLRRGYDDFIMDNPTRVEVENVVAAHRDVIQQIEQVAPGSVGVEIDSLTCEGKADLLIWYGTHPQRVAIEQIIAGETFLGIPYRLQNR
jgi:hypothetical protein